MLGTANLLLNPNRCQRWTHENTIQIPGHLSAKWLSIAGDDRQRSHRHSTTVVFYAAPLMSLSIRCSMFVIEIDSLTVQRTFLMTFVLLTVCARSLAGRARMSLAHSSTGICTHIINVEHWWIFKIIFGAFNISTARDVVRTDPNSSSLFTFPRREKLHCVWCAPFISVNFISTIIFDECVCVWGARGTFASAWAIKRIW